jgi:hypothetical protein
MVWAVMARPRCKGTVKIVHYNKMQKQAYDFFLWWVWSRSRKVIPDAELVCIACDCWLTATLIPFWSRICTVMKKNGNEDHIRSLFGHVFGLSECFSNNCGLIYFDTSLYADHDCPQRTVWSRHCSTQQSDATCHMKQTGSSRASMLLVSSLLMIRRQPL